MITFKNLWLTSTWWDFQAYCCLLAWGIWGVTLQLVIELFCVLRHNADVAFKMQLQLLRLRTSDYKLCDFDKCQCRLPWSKTSFTWATCTSSRKLKNIGEANCNFVVDILCFLFLLVIFIFMLNLIKLSNNKVRVCKILSLWTKISDVSFFNKLFSSGTVPSSRQLA